jgi:hypothetical protein
MLFLIMIGVGIILGLVCNVFNKNGNIKLNKSNQFKINKSYLIFIIVISRLIVVFLRLQNVLLVSELIQLGLLLILIYYNRKEIGIIVASIGFILNLIVMIFNNGKMPVRINNTQVPSWDIKHSIMSEITHIRWLGDIVSIPYPLNIGIDIASVGDFVVVIGVSILCFRLMRSINNKTY